MATNSKKKAESWKQIQDDLAADTGLAIVLVEDDGLSSIAKSNDNSICEMLTSSKEHSLDCRRFCGKMFSTAIKGKHPVKYKCHAGLECIATVVNPESEKKFVAITGRAFSKAGDYRKATERAVGGTWKEFPPTKFFGNILLTSSSTNIEKLAGKLGALTKEEKETLFEIGSAKENRPKKEDLKADQPEPSTKGDPNQSVELVRQDKSNSKSRKQVEIESRTLEGAQEFTEWGAFFTSIHNLEYRGACRRILQFLSDRYDISSMAWLENVENNLKKVLAIGALEQQKIRISLKADDKRFMRILRKRNSVELREQIGDSRKSDFQTVHLFPIVQRGKIRSALVLGERYRDQEMRLQISRFCQLAASELEIIRLRQKLIKQSWLDNAFIQINKSLTMIDSSQFWSSITQTAADLVNAGRGSILVYDDKGENLVVRAAIGRKADFIEKSETDIGERIAKKVWKSGKPLVVVDIGETGLAPAPLEREYRTGSFISYPLSIGKRRVGVLNVTDKNDAGVFDANDLKLLKSITPQLSVAIDRATLESKAGEFEQLSVTDPLTGLLNRRYLEERLTEEIRRSDRHGYPMSFVMIDVDEFKSYNDAYTHPEGDKALQLVGQCLRESLRDADVAARYGGEEFSILLPQTNLEEARVIAERLRNRIETTRFPNRQVTVSIGITGASSTRETAEKIISAADKALFEAKRQGRNNVQTYEYVRKNLEIQN